LENPSGIMVGLAAQRPTIGKVVGIGIMFGFATQRPTIGKVMGIMRHHVWSRCAKTNHWKKLWG